MVFAFLLLLKGKVLAYRALYLNIHLVLHINLGLATAQVDNNDVDDDEHDENPHDESFADALAFVLHGVFNILEGLLHRFQWLFVQRLHALTRGVLESGTDRIKDGQGLNLTSESLLVDHHRGVDICSKLAPVVDLIIDELVCSAL